MSSDRVHNKGSIAALLGPELDLVHDDPKVYWGEAIGETSVFF